MRHFPHHIGDYAAATAHLSFVEDAAYHRLLRLYYRDERPLPAEVAACQRLAGARTKEERDAITLILGEFFIQGEDGWRQPRADRELEAYQSRAETARENGQRGGRPRTGRKPKSEPAENQVGYSTDTQTEPSQKLTKNQEPLTNNQVESAFALYVSAAERKRWTKPRKLDPERAKKIAARIREYGDDEWRLAIEKAESSRFICEEMSGWSLDWLLKPANFKKVIEGNYDNKAPTAPRMQTMAPTLPEDWAWRVDWHREKGMWNPSWGPEPGQPGCFVPKEFLQ